MKKFLSMIWSATKIGASRTLSFAKHHTIVAGVIAVAVVGAGYWGFSTLAANTGNTEYVLGTVTKAPLQVTVTGSGQVTANDTLNLSPKASGEITSVTVTPGQAVKAGTIVAVIDMTTAVQAVQSARENLQSAQISYQQSLTSSQSSATNDQSSLATAQKNDLAALASSYTSLDSVMIGLNGVLYDFSTITGHTTQKNVDAYESFVDTAQSQQYHDRVAADYATAAAAYQRVQAEYSSSVPSSMSIAQIEQLNRDTLAATETISTILKDTLIYYNYINTQVTSAKILTPTQLASQIASLTTYQNTVTSNDASLANAASSLVNAQQTMEADTQSLGNGDIPLTLQSAQLNLQKSQEALTQALADEENYIVRAPFDGVIATVSAKKYDQASSGTAVATLITTKEYADLSLNETDAATIATGQKATIIFDAINGLTMSGTVAEVAGIGTVSQGVVTYNVKVGFDTVDSRIKPGMTAQATITTASVDDAIQVPSGALKTSGGSSYVEVATLKNASSTMANGNGTGAARRFRTASSTSLSGSALGGTGSSTGFASISRSLTVPVANVTLTRVPVTLGIANDTMTQITSGLSAGQFVVTQTTTNSTTKTTSTSSTNLLSSLFGGSRRAPTGTAGATSRTVQTPARP